MHQRFIACLLPAAAWPACADEFMGVVIAPEAEADYDRDRDYGSGWRDDDGDCQDARQEVLIAEALFDEVWSFVAKKQRHLTATDDPQRVGDVWTFVALDADTKLVPCYRIGKRDLLTASF